MPVLIHGSVTNISAALASASVLAGIKCASMDLSELRDVLKDAILDSLERAQIPIKEAAACAGMSDSHFRKALAGEGNKHLSIVHLMGLPYKFWLTFGPNLMWLVAKKHAIEIAESFSVARRA